MYLCGNFLRDSIMVIIMGILALGISAGYLLRHRKIKVLDNIIPVTIWALLFLLGVEAGSDERIVRWIASLGVEAFIISLGGIIGSSIFAFGLWKYSRTPRYGRRCDEG